jgi:lysophospholipase L1-like esterase
MKISKGPGPFLSELTADLGLSRSPPPRERRVALVGDSITAYDGGYGRRLQQDLPNWQIDNFGWAGQKSGEVRQRLQVGKADTSKKEVDLSKYGTVVILCGVNNIDRPEEVKADLQAMYRLAHENGVRVVAVQLTPWKDYANAKGTSWTPQRQSNTDQVNQWIRTAAKDVDLVVDASPALRDPKNPQATRTDLTKDKLHPNPKGQDAMGDEVFNAAFRRSDTKERLLLEASRLGAWLSRQLR